jgi:hypothetical protein
MATFFGLLLGYIRDCFRSHERLKAEILILRHQLNILHRTAPKRLRLSGGDRALFVWLYRRFPDIGNATATRGYSFRKGQPPFDAKPESITILPQAQKGQY